MEQNEIDALGQELARRAGDDAGTIRKMVGKFQGVEIWSDPNMPDDELRFVQNGKIVEVIRLS